MIRSGTLKITTQKKAIIWTTLRLELSLSAPPILLAEIKVESEA